MNKLDKIVKICDVFCCVLQHKWDLIELTTTQVINSEKIATNWAEGIKFQVLILITKKENNLSKILYFIGLDSNLVNGLKIKYYDQ